MMSHPVAGLVLCKSVFRGGEGLSSEREGSKNGSGAPLS